MTEAPRLLLVEDDPQLRAMLDTLLTEEGYVVDTAPDGQRGLHLGLTRSYDVVLLDRGLPAIDGLDLLSRLRLRGVTTPTLVLSALANPADRVAGLDAGAEDYLGKPFSRQQLLAIVFDEAESEAVVDTYVHYLRRKLGRTVIDTVRGRGYQLGRGR